MLSNQEINRYSRHLSLPDFGIEGQEKLKNASILVVGAGGLGSPVLLYLAAAGVGRIGIIDDDTVDETNLQRQVLYGYDDIGRKKVVVAQERIQSINPHIDVEVHQYRLNCDNAVDLISQYDVVADGSDNFATRYLVNDACVLAGKVNVFASIFQFEGQVSVLNYPLENGGRSCNYRDIFPEAPKPGEVPNCADGGVLGVLPGMIGTMQASEVIKVIAGLGKPLINRIFLFDALNFTSRMVELASTESQYKITELESYDEYCVTHTNKKQKMELKEITVQELKALQDSGDEFKFIDVREKREFDFVNLGAELIPQATVLSHPDSFDYDGEKVVVHCRSGKRSGDVIMILQQKYGYENLYNLKGGILAYAREIDQSLPTY